MMKSFIIGALALTSLSSFAAKEVCGTNGTLEARIRDCKNVQKEGFVLVARTKYLKEIFEVYLEVRTGLLWSDRLYPNTLNFTNALRACDYVRAEMAGISNVTWELPTMNDYKEANRNGIKQALPNMDEVYWTSTENRDNPTSGWMFHGIFGNFESHNRNNVGGGARCVAKSYIR